MWVSIIIVSFVLIITCVSRPRYRRVELQWIPVTNAALYNVYRFDENHKDKPEWLGTTGRVAKYIDSTAQSGTVYKYAVTSVDMQGVESGYSDIVEVRVP